jgi:hypothetical protein
MTLLLSFCLYQHNDEKWIDAKSSAVPRNYLYLYFPVENKQIEAGGEENGIATNTILSRAVTVSQQEKEDGVVSVILGDDKEYYVRLSELTLLPIEKEKKLLNKWNDALKYQGYTKGSWNKKMVGKGIWLVELTLTDSKHARQERYAYYVEGGEISKIMLIDIRSGVLEGIIIFVSILLLIIIFLMWFIWKIIRKRKNSMVSP